MLRFLCGRAMIVPTNVWVGVGAGLCARPQLAPSERELFLPPSGREGDRVGGGGSASVTIAVYQTPSASFYSAPPSRREVYGRARRPSPTYRHECVRCCRAIMAWGSCLQQPPPKREGIFFVDKATVPPPGYVPCKAPLTPSDYLYLPWRGDLACNNLHPSARYFFF